MNIKNIKAFNRSRKNCEYFSSRTSVSLANESNKQLWNRFYRILWHATHMLSEGRLLVVHQALPQMNMKETISRRRCWLCFCTFQNIFCRSQRHTNNVTHTKHRKSDLLSSMKLKNKSEHKYINSSFFHLTIETETEISAGVFRRQSEAFA